MKLEQITLIGFQCFGPEGVTVSIEEGITTLVGGNGAGKTALLQGLSRLFGVTPSQRAIRKTDFHLAEEQDLQSGAELGIEAVFSFPELEREDDPGPAIPEFFRQMAASGPGGPLKVRVALWAEWTDDGTPSGAIEEDIKWVHTLEESYDWDDDCRRVAAIERSAVQFIYIPATRNVHDQVNALLKGRLWQAAKWSDEFKTSAEETTTQLQETFKAENPAGLILEKVEARWRQVHDGDTDTTPILRLVDHKFEDFVRKADFAFLPDEEGHERPVDQLSDGQRSLFHVALTAATLEVEKAVFDQAHGTSPFDHEKLRQVSLTILALEEPENSLSPFFLSRIVRLSRDIGKMDTAQVVMSSHSSAILGRIEAEEVRYLRRTSETRKSTVKSITLPEDDLDAKRYVRLAVRAYPELYFARFVILAEGDSEKLVIPRIAEAMGVDLDPSFVPIVPLGGRYCGYFWSLLNNLEIPFATLLDFDIGRRHGGANLIREIVGNLDDVGIELDEHVAATGDELDLEDLDDLSDADLWVDYTENNWIHALEEKGVFLSDPLDLDFAMLEAFPEAYQVPHPGGQGPATSEKAVENGKKATLKKLGDSTLYSEAYSESFRWYPYLFLNGSKPDSHLSALGRIDPSDLASDAPEALRALVDHVKSALGLEDNL